jgi:hypothetical protein
MNKHTHILETFNKPFEYGGVLLNISLAVQFMVLWINPGLNDASKIYNNVILIAFEFIMIHSGIAMSLLPAIVSVVLVFPFYGLFAYTMNKLSVENVVMYTYLIVVLNRMRFAFFNVSDNLKKLNQEKSALMALIYVVLILFVVVFKFLLPKLGLQPGYLVSSGYNEIKQISGIFTDEPHVALCFGVLYFLSLSLVEFSLIHPEIFDKLYKKLESKYPDLKSKRRKNEFDFD